MTEGDPTNRERAGHFDFDEAFRTHFAYVWHTLRRLGVRPGDLEDVTHDVFVIVHRKQNDYDPARPLRPWLFGIAANSASDYRRRARYTRELSVEGAETTDDRPDAEASLIERERRRLVERALASIDPSRLPVFVLHEMDEVPMPDVVEALGIPLNTGYSRLRLAREDFRAAVQRLRARGER